MSLHIGIMKIFPLEIAKVAYYRVSIWNLYMIYFVVVSFSFCILVWIEIAKCIGYFWKAFLQDNFTHKFV